MGRRDAHVGPLAANPFGRRARRREIPLEQCGCRQAVERNPDRCRHELADRLIRATHSLRRIGRGLRTMFGIRRPNPPHNVTGTRRDVAVSTCPGAGSGRDIVSSDSRNRWIGTAMTLASTVLVASCISPGQTVESRGPVLAPAIGVETQTARDVGQLEASGAGGAGSLSVLDPPLPANSTAVQAGSAQDLEAGVGVQNGWSQSPQTRTIPDEGG